MKIEGYKLNGYDATYRKALFNVNERGVEGRVLKVTDINSGMTFIFDLTDDPSSLNISTKTKKKDVRTGVWRSHKADKK